MQPPIARRQSHITSHHGIVRDDPYDWLRDPGFPKVEEATILAHLAAENAWFEAWLAPHAATVETLFGELKGRVKPDDAGVPVRDGAHDYWWRFAPGGQYRIWVRARSDGSGEQIILDEPALAAAHDYFRLRRACDQSRRTLARLRRRHRRVGALHASYPRPRHRRDRTGDHRRQHRYAGVGGGQHPAVLDRGQRPVAAVAGAPAHPRQWRTRRRRLRGNGWQLLRRAGPQPGPPAASSFALPTMSPPRHG